MLYVINLLKRTRNYVEFQTYVCRDANEVDKLIDGKSARDYTVVEVPEEDLTKGAVRVL